MVKEKGAVRREGDGMPAVLETGGGSTRTPAGGAIRCENEVEACAALGAARGEAVVLPYDGFPAVRLVLAARLTTRLRGLLMSPASDVVLLLAPCHDIHTFGMGYAIDVAFIDEAGAVLQSRRDVLPNRRLRNRHASAVLERFAMPREVWFEEGDKLAIGTFRAPGPAAVCQVRNRQ